MTHAEAGELLPLYALDALEPAETSALEMHVSECHACAGELRSFESAAAGLGSAVPALNPPARLRERVLASGAEALPSVPFSPRPERLGEGTPPARHLNILRFPTRAPSWLAAAVLVVALAGGAVAGFARDAGDRAQLRTDDAALALLTSTETTIERLEPASGSLPTDTHGHWYHRNGVPTQVIVGEFLPALGGGQHYVAWQRRGQVWQRAGELDGHSRLVVLASDGAGISAVEITREAGQSTRPSSDVVMRFPKP